MIIKRHHMRWVLFNLVWMIPCTIWAQISENFESGNLSGWTQYPPGRWEVSSEYVMNGTGSLHHAFDNPTSGHDQISLPVPNLRLPKGTAAWTFTVRYAYPPSALNNWCFFLLSSSDASGMFPGGNTSGYAIGVNFTGSDDMVKLWKHEPGLIEPVIETSFNWEAMVSTNQVVMFDVHRTPDGLWTIHIDTTGTGDHYANIGSGHDHTYQGPGYSGLYYEYSSAQDRKLWFDDLLISGYFSADSVAPEIEIIRVVDSHTLFLGFNEPVKTLNASDSLRFIVEPGMGHPEDIRMADPSSIHIRYTAPFTDGTAYVLHMDGIEDLSSNRSEDTTLLFTYHEVKPYDVVINEIMADPIPSVGLPEVEYIELLNNTQYALHLQDWDIEIGNNRKPMAAVDLPPGAFAVVISTSDTAHFSSVEHTIVVDQMPSLSNSGQEITIYDPYDQVISHVEYRDEWYRNDLKSNGGWSLEQIDPLYPCQGETNWKASNDAEGGSPGRINSVYQANPDHRSPELIKAIIQDDQVVEVTFSEPYHRTGAREAGYYTVDRNMGHPDSVAIMAPVYDRVLLYFSGHFEPGILYTLSVDERITDCSGNGMAPPANILFGHPEQCDSLDVVINEVLFNPYFGGSDFVEVINLSDKIIDLSTLFIASRSNDDQSIGPFHKFSEDPFLLLPDQYLAITEDIDKVVPFYWQYDEKNMLEIYDMPAYSNEQGTVLVMDQSLNIIDEFAYSEDLHFALLESTEGVSLEKIHPLLSSEGMHWHSAAEDAGFATPGLVNSQFTESVDPPEPVWVEPEVFSPDNDGYHDLVLMHYQFSSPGNVASVYVFNSEGRQIRRLANNRLLGTSGSIAWNGENENGDRAEIGIYVFLMELYNLQGELKIFKKTCVLASRLK